MAKGIHGRIIIGIMLVLIGFVMFAQNYEQFQILIPEFVYEWQTWFIFAGILFLLLARNKVAGAVLISIGIFNLFPELWPLILVLIGLYIIYGRGGRSVFHFNINAKTENGEHKSTEFFEQVSLFGGGKKVVFSDNFKGGNIVSIFGGSEVNLLNSKLADGENIIEVISIFGGSSIIVPHDWKVEVDVLPIFGGFGDKRRTDPNQVYDSNKLLIIKGVAIFGGGEVKTVF